MQSELKVGGLLVMHCIDTVSTRILLHFYVNDLLLKKNMDVV
jgi:hypothetical protein